MPTCRNLALERRLDPENAAHRINVPRRVDRGEAWRTTREAWRTTDMAIAFTLPRISGFALALLAFTIMAGARGEDAPAPPAQQPAATPPGQKSGGAAGRAATPNSPASPTSASSPATAEAHRPPPCQHTKNTAAAPGPHAHLGRPRGPPPRSRQKGGPESRYRLHRLPAR